MAYIELGTREETKSAWQRCRGRRNENHAHKRMKSTQVKAMRARNLRGGGGTERVENESAEVASSETVFRFELLTFLGIQQGRHPIQQEGK